MMKLRFLFSLLFTICILHSAAFSQKLTTPEIYEQSEADLVIVGKIDGYDHGYNRTDSEYLDSTFAYFHISQVLKGKYSEKTIEVRFPDHLAFGDDSSVILFITNNMKLVAGDKKLGNCSSSPCFYSKSDWVLENTAENLKQVNKLFKIKK